MAWYNNHTPHCHASLPHLQNLEVLYRQYGRDGNKHGLDWQEVAVAIIQDGVSHCDTSVLAASTVTVRRRMRRGLLAGALCQGWLQLGARLLMDTAWLL